MDQDKNKQGGQQSEELKQAQQQNIAVQPKSVAQKSSAIQQPTSASIQVQNKQQQKAQIENNDKPIQKVQKVESVEEVEKVQKIQDINALIKEPSKQEKQKQQTKKQRQEKQKQKLKTIFTDASSPYASAPNKIKQLLKETEENEEVRLEKINLEKLGFELKAGRSNFCSHFVLLDGKQQYMMCTQCKTEGCIGMCYCSSCYLPEAHQGHTVVKQSITKGYAFCDCGRSERIANSCPTHAQSQILPCQIAEQDRREFVDSITALLECAVYCTFNKCLLMKIYSFLCTLNEGSIYYNRLTFETLTQKSKAISQQQIKQSYVDVDYFYFILMEGARSKHKQIQYLMVHMCGDLETRMKLTKFVCKVLDNGGLKTIQRYIDQVNLQQLLTMDSIQKLSQQGFYHKILQASYQDKLNIQICKLSFEKYMKNRISSMKTILQLNDINYKAIPINSKQLLLLKSIQLFPNSEAILVMIQVEQLKKNPKFDIKTAKIRLKMLPKEVEIGIVAILQLLYLVCESEIQRVRNIRQHVLNMGVSEQKIDQFIDWTIYGITYQLFYLNLQKMTNMNIVILLTLMKNSPKEQFFIQKIWDLLLECHNPQAINAPVTKQLSSSEIQIYADMFHFTVTLILRADLNILMAKNAIKGKLQQQQQQYMQSWFRSFLYERKFLQRDDMLNIKGYGYLQFRGSTEILNQVCTYNEQFQRFQYNTSKIYKNISNKFPLIPSKNSFGTIYRNQVHFGQQANLGQNSLSKQLITKFLRSKNIVPLLDEEWQRYLRSVCKNDGKYYYGICYLFMLLYVDILTDGHNQQLRSRLQIIKDDITLVDQFTSIDLQKNLICRMLMVDKIKASPEKLMKAQQKIAQSPEQKKIKGQEKKKKLKQKFEAHNKIILEKAQSHALESMISEEEELCILCHEKQKPNNQLVYICNINKNMTVGTAIFGEGDLARTYISSCYHAMHVNCFTSYKKEANFNFNCPLCQKVSNCILPLSIHKNAERLNKICENAKIASIVAMTSSYNVESSFLIIFKHLVESKGLNSVIEKSRYKENKKAWGKNDTYLQSLLIQMYDNADEKKRTSFLRSLDKFVEEINNCPKQQIKLIQLLFTQIYRKIATTESVEANLQLLQQIRAKVSQEDFTIINEQIQGLVDELIVLQPQTTQQQERPKLSLSMKLAPLPKNSFECFKKYQGKCVACGKESLNICIICSHLSCNECYIKHYNEIHRGIIFSLNFTNFKVSLLCKSTNTAENVYENELKLPLQQALKIKGTNLNSFILNEAKYEKLIKTFLQN